MLKATFNINSGYFIKCCMHTYMISLSIPNYPSWRSSEAYHTQEKVRNLYTLGKLLNSNIVDKGRTIRYLRGGGGWAITKKKFAHRKNPEKKYRAQQTY